MIQADSPEEAVAKAQGAGINVQSVVRVTDASLTHFASTMHVPSDFLGIENYPLDYVQRIENALAYLEVRFNR